MSATSSAELRLPAQAETTPPAATVLAIRREKEIGSLTFLRFVAAGYVFIMHMYFHSRFPVAQPELSNFLRHGAMGMTIFFLLSGFVMGYTYYQANVSAADYFKRRVARIVPVYMLAAFLTLPWFWSLMPVTMSPRTADRGIMIALSHVFMLQAWMPALTNYWNFGASWSVSVEAFFYLTFPFVLSHFSRFSRTQLCAAIFCSYFAVAYISFGTALFNESSFYRSPIYRFPEFLIGVACAVGYLRGDIRLPRPGACVMAATTLLGLYLCYVKPSILHTDHSYFTVPILGIIILGLAQTTHSRTSRYLLSNPLFLLLGRSSYCLYLLQSVTILSLLTYRDVILQAVPAFQNPWILLSFNVLSLVGVSILVHLCFEEPLRRRISRLRFGQRTKAAA